MALPLVSSFASPLATPARRVRAQVAATVRNLLAGDRQVDDFAEPAGDPGWFGPGSMVWRVHADRSMLIGGVRALFLQTMHPLAMAGVAEHSDYRHDPLGRLWRTGDFLATTSFGSTAAAEKAVAVVRAVHGRVNGVARDGRPYDANDPALLRWVHATEVDSFLRAHRRYGAGSPLTPEEADRYVDEMARVAVALGADQVPRSVDELAESLRSFRPQLRAGAQARETARWLCAPPLPLVARPAYGVICSAAIGLLPAWVRRQLWLPWPPLVDALAVRPAARTLVTAMGWVLADTETPATVARSRVSA